MNEKCSTANPPSPSGSIDRLSGTSDRALLETRNLCKRYGSHLANDRISLSINPGEIVGLVGENGAGKTTLLSILAGMTAADSGDLLIDGVKQAIASPMRARQSGISITYQHFSIVPTFTVAEQLRLAGWNSAELPELLRGTFSGKETVGRLSLGEQQRIEIAKALVSQPRVLLLDEPTSILTRGEADLLFDVVRKIRDQGTAVVFVTHKLSEAISLCDRVIAMRRGRIVGSVEQTSSGWPTDTEQQLLGMMFGRDGSSIERPSVRSSEVQSKPCTALFRLDRISTDPEPELRALRNISLEVDPCELLVIVGVDGQGQRELADVCAGYRHADGQISLNAQHLNSGRSREFFAAGISCLTDDRIDEGTVPDFTIEETLIMKRQRELPFSRLGRLQRSKIREQAIHQIERWTIEPAEPGARIRTLSGGNIQKVMLAREFARDASLLIANKPSHGLDARTQRVVWDAMHAFVERGGGAIVFTSDLDEALAQGHRIAVMFEGRLSSPVAVSSIQRTDLERMMVSGWQESAP
ncbi:MAG: ATP-binding cassette domain-containing protein [Thermomicrobiales bacterium]